jgi:hypothetical protein
MRATLVVATALLLLSGNGVAKAADPTRLAETGGFLLGNAHRCGIETERVEHAGTVIHDMIVSALRSDRGSCCRFALCPDLYGERFPGPRR